MLDRLLEAGAAFHREAERFKQRVPGGHGEATRALGAGRCKETEGQGTLAKPGDARAGDCKVALLDS